MAAVGLAATLSRAVRRAPRIEELLVSETVKAGAR
jgi:hypothetical protein